MNGFAGAGAPRTSPCPSWARPTSNRRRGRRRGRARRGGPDRRAPRGVSSRPSPVAAGRRRAHGSGRRALRTRARRAGIRMAGAAGAGMLGSGKLGIGGAPGPRAPGAPPPRPGAAGARGRARARRDAGRAAPPLLGFLLLRLLPLLLALHREGDLLLWGSIERTRTFTTSPTFTISLGSLTKWLASSDTWRSPSWETPTSTKTQSWQSRARSLELLPGLQVADRADAAVVDGADELPTRIVARREQRAHVLEERGGRALVGERRELERAERLGVSSPSDATFAPFTNFSAAAAWSGWTPVASSGSAPP